MGNACEAALKVSVIVPVGDAGPFIEAGAHGEPVVKDRDRDDRWYLPGELEAAAAGASAAAGQGARAARDRSAHAVSASPGCRM